MVQFEVLHTYIKTDIEYLPGNAFRRARGREVIDVYNPSTDTIG